VACTSYVPDTELDDDCLKKKIKGNLHLSPSRGPLEALSRPSRAYMGTFEHDTAPGSIWRALGPQSPPVCIALPTRLACPPPAPWHVASPAVVARNARLGYIR
jgi:hypothetical protein